MLLISTLLTLGEAALFYDEQGPLYIQTSSRDTATVTLELPDEEHKFSQCALGVRNNKTKLLLKKDASKEEILEGAYSIAVEIADSKPTFQILGNGVVLKGYREEEVHKAFNQKLPESDENRSRFHLQIEITRIESRLVAYERKVDGLDGKKYSQHDAQIVWACWNETSEIVEWDTYIANISSIAAIPGPARAAVRAQNECWTDEEYVEYGDATIRGPRQAIMARKKEDRPAACQDFCRSYHEASGKEGDKGVCTAWNYNKYTFECFVITKEMEKMELVKKGKSHVIPDEIIFVSGPRTCHADAREPIPQKDECWDDKQEIIDGRLIEVTTLGTNDPKQCQELCRETIDCENWSFDKRYFDCFPIAYDEEGQYALKTGTGEGRHLLSVDHFVAGPKTCNSAGSDASDDNGSGEVKCGGEGHKAATCGQCPDKWSALDETQKSLFNKQTYCNGDCIWDVWADKCTKATAHTRVSCGGHHATSCSGCVKNGWTTRKKNNYCNGDCKWSGREGCQNKMQSIEP